jgi:hypothetical protein
MRFKDIKQHIKRLEQENSDLRKSNCVLRQLDERIYPFNYLEIVVRPRRQEHLFGFETMGMELKVEGNENMPNFVTYKTIQLSTFDILQKNKYIFIKEMGERMAEELMAYGEKVKENL